MQAERPNKSTVNCMMIRGVLRRPSPDNTLMPACRKSIPPQHNCAAGRAVAGGNRKILFCAQPRSEARDVDLDGGELGVAPFSVSTAGGPSGSAWDHRLADHRRTCRLACRQVVRGGGFGLIGDIVVGIVGAFIGGWLGGVLGLSIGSGFIASVITAIIGAVILLIILRAIRRA